MDDFRREVEERGGVEGLREETRRAMEDLDTQGRRAQERATSMFSSLLDGIESRIGE